MKKASIMLVDNNKAFRDALKLIISQYEDFEIIGEAENGLQALEMLDKILPDLVCMDIQMPEMNGIDAAKLMQRKSDNIKFIAVTMYRDNAYLINLLKAGFKGCIFKDNVYDELKGALTDIMNNKYFFPTDIKLSK